ncbi:uncharacterized protein LOC116342317 isoform X2 [Contarinia nasturtii]|uniref:uncharacterized protein LOC116342317 isoform X2 n=1 Tax=Contarinia nasturtii TaxID=265458 RepID=UPI0012D40055|nr:uncharacterized protein LOC116342317 isoform X2 [Contarinia nasturtii]
MRVVAMVSGGKDSSYNMMKCVAEGHEIVALANLHPKDKDELDSYMYQTVGHMGITKLAEAMELPLYRMETKGQSTQTGKYYVPTDDDEVEDLYNLLKMTKDEVNVEAVAVGAIFSDYQRIRVENVCMRLNLVPLAYLWRRDQTELLQEMIDCQVHSIIIKVASLGLVPDRHLGKSLRELQPHLEKMREKYGLNVCGEGGEYESFTLNCPLFKQQICIEDFQTIISSSDPVCPVGYINFTKLRLMAKSRENEAEVVVKKSIDYISDLNESSYSDLSDPDLSETELEHIEMENRMKESMSKEEIAILSRSNSLSQSGSLLSSPVRIITKKLVGSDEESSVNGGASGSYATRNGLLDVNTNDVTDGLASKNLTLNYDIEQRPIENKPNIGINPRGWMWIAGIQGVGATSAEGMQNAIDALVKIVTENGYELNNLCYISLYVRSMNDYAELNDVYVKAFNFQNPPSRVCIESPLPDGLQVIMEGVAFKPRNSDINNQRHTMHVQSISHWAPANIGPYSQSTRVGEITYIAGQIALVPGSMTIIDGGIRPQCKLALRHISRIAKAMNTHGQLRDIVQGICFVTNPNHIAEARRQLERRTTNAIMDYIVVPALPRKALVEWQVWAHSHNDKFDYEETGCSVGDYTVSSRRRWNYENNCAAIVCYVSTGLATSSTQLTDLSDDIIQRHQKLAIGLTVDNVNDILQYIVNKLLKSNGVPSADSAQKQSSSNPSNTGLPAIHLKVFYQVSATPPIGLLTRSIAEFAERISNLTSIAFSVLPASSLHNFSTFLSIYGIRHL